jgi:hypothetical protein
MQRLREAIALYERRSSQEILKANRMPLSKDERDKVLKAGAVWHKSPGGKESAAVWKSKDSRGNIKYGCNTHRAMAVKDTLAGAIRAFRFIKTTA